MANEKPELVWNGGRALLPKNQVKLLLNLVLVALAAIPRGGKITVTLKTFRPSRNSRWPRAARCCACRRNSWSCIPAPAPEEPIDAHSVQPYYTLLLAREAK